MYLKCIETCLTQESSNIRNSIVAACLHVHAFQNKLITRLKMSSAYLFANTRQAVTALKKEYCPKNFGAHGPC